ncbi:MAG TPA: hypothetical protein PLZ08_06770 [Bacillota bacterium]|jgi:hypothetical protein|nr:hypothetical protein [Bacillota bacterium]HOL09323.1 hypothetical protein [Bacillota bacterium]HPO97646.1 hypothetical protein [Bacillota bacterium]
MRIKHYWYEKLFFMLQLNERRLFLAVFLMLFLILITQFMLTYPAVRSQLVIVEQYEGTLLESR